MSNLALLSHAPSAETLELILKQSGDWQVYQYLFHVDRLKDLERYTLELVTELSQELDLERCGRILLGMPGHSVGGALLIEALTGISGRAPDLLVTVRGPGGSWVPCPEKPFVQLGHMRGRVRKQRTHGFLVC